MEKSYDLVDVCYTEFSKVTHLWLTNKNILINQEQKHLE